METLILVTGGTGFLGRHLMPILLENNDQLRMLVRSGAPPPWLSNAEIEFAPGDLTDPESLSLALTGCRTVIHAAGYFRLWGPSQKFDQVNRQGTQHLFRAAVRAGVRKLIYVSSLAVVGGPPADGRPIDEGTICRPRDAYQRSKLAAERIVQRAAQEEALNAVIIRPGAFYGPFGRYGFNRLFIEDPLRGILIQVDGGRRLTFPTFVPDAARAIWAAVDAGRSGEIYHVSGDSVTHARVNRVVSECAGIRSWRLNAPRRVMIALAFLMEASARLTGKEPFYPLNLKHYVFQDWRVRCCKAREELGFEPTPLEEGLRSTVAWYRSMDVRSGDAKDRLPIP